MASILHEASSDAWLQLAMGLIPVEAMPKDLDPTPLGGLALFGAELEIEPAIDGEEPSLEV